MPIYNFTRIFIYFFDFFKCLLGYLWLIRIKNRIKLKFIRWVKLATVSQDNFPRVRTVVFRGWCDSYEMKILTDKRSNKFSELATNKNAEICWFYSKFLCKFRLSETSAIDLGEDTIFQWNQLATQSKSMWGWHHLVKNIILIKIIKHQLVRIKRY